ncbi:MAG: hypothetical protein AAGJ28_00490 [Pseudomonadota bacterium]
MFYSLLKKIEKRPAMYLGGDATMKDLRSFISGYGLCMRENDLQDDEFEKFRSYFNKIYLPEVSGMSAETGWRSMINSLGSDSEFDRLELFFRVFEDYSRSRGRARPSRS